MKKLFFVIFTAFTIIGCTSTKETSVDKNSQTIETPVKKMDAEMDSRGNYLK